MARRFIDASTYFLYIDPANGTDYDNVVCLTTFDLNMTAATNNTTTMCGISSSPGEKTSTINLSGLTLLDPDTGEISAPDLFTLIDANSTFAWKIGKAVPGSGDVTKSGHGFFSSYTENYSATDRGGFTASISVDGAIVVVNEVGS